MNVPNVDPTPIKVDPVYIASQFERINVTLEFFGKALDKSNDKAEAQDRVIDTLVSDMSVVKSDIKFLKEAKPRPLHPVVLWGSVLSGITSAIAIVVVVINSTVSF